MSLKWRRRIYLLMIIAAVQFVVLTTIAMLVYPGGTISNPSTDGYSFFRNFFSELGLTRTHLGEPNPLAASLFFVALSGAGVGLILFALAFPAFFREGLLNRLLSLLGSFFLLGSGLSYIGVAFTPANLRPEAHNLFVLLAFSAFLGASLCYALPIWRQPAYPNRYAVLFAFFALLLAAYVALLLGGPSFTSSRGLVVQATAQKVIVYAAILIMLVEGFGAWRQLADEASG